jgi:hypothetical protein
MSCGQTAGKVSPIERRMRELGDVQALVVGAFAEHSADVHMLADGLAEAAIPCTSCHYLHGGPVKGEGCSEGVTICSFRRGSLEHPVNTPAVTPLLRRRPSDCESPAQA